MKLSEQLTYCTTEIINIINETQISIGTGLLGEILPLEEYCKEVKEVIVMSKANNNNGQNTSINWYRNI